MKSEITGRSEIEILINTFYEKVKTDPLIGPFFNHVRWESHLPLMYDFWENALFFTGGYTGNPLAIHQAFHKRHPLNAQHFARWQDIFLATLDEQFAGEKAELARQRALSISAVMQIKTFGADTK